jgi:outer membrane protein TolC
MKKLFYILSLLGLIVISLNTIQAQNIESDNSLLRDSKFKFPPLEVIIDSVMKHSAMINFRNKRIGVMESDLKSSKRDWTKNFGFVADTRYGTFDNFLTNSTGINSSSSSSYSKQLNYTVGLFLKIPVFDIFNRKNKIKLASLEVEEARSMAEFQEEEIRQAVIIMYQDLILKQKLLQIRSRMFGDGKVNMQMIEKEFRNGIVPLAEYVRIVGMTENMEAEYETAMSEFITAKQLLEDIAGFTFGLTYLN